MSSRIPADIRTPAYVIDIAKLRANCETAARVRREAGAKVLLATKAFAMPAAFPFMAEFLDGTTASGLYEAKLAHETFAPDPGQAQGEASHKEVHVYSPAYTDDEFAALAGVAGHVYFNSATQLAKYGPAAKARGQHVALRTPGNKRELPYGSPHLEPVLGPAQKSHAPAWPHIVRTPSSHPETQP